MSVYVHLRTGLVAVLLLFNGSVTASPEYTIKFATLAPSGTTWMNLLEDWDKDLRAKSNGRIGFKFYPGGVQGDEPDVLKKMRFNQLQGGAFTGYGIGRMYSPSRVLELPFLFNNTDEIDFVRKQFTTEFKQGFEDNGYVLLGWMEVGFIHMFSKQPIYSLEDMRTRRIWLWQGDPMGKAFFSASDISPVPLSIVDVYTSLSTGLIDTVYAPPLGAIALQWFTKTQYVSSVPMTNGMGGLIVSKKFYAKLPADLQKILSETGKAAGEKLIAATRIDNELSIDTLKQRGLQFIEPNDGMNEQALTKVRDSAATELVASGYIPGPVYEKTRSLLKQFRTDHANQSAP